MQAEPGQVTGITLAQLVDAFAGIGQAAVVAAVVQLGADAVAGCPLVVEAGEEVATVFVFGRQVVEVGAVVGEALGNADIGLQQCGVEAPVERLDIGVPPAAFVAAQALTADAQVFAGVGGEAGVVDPEFAHGQVALVRLARVAALGAVFAVVLQRVGFDGIGGGNRLAHGEGAPVATLAVGPGAQVETDTVDVATVAGAEVTVVFRLRRDLHIQAEILRRIRRPGGAGRQQAGAQTQLTDDSVNRSLKNYLRWPYRVKSGLKMLIYCS